MDYTTSPLTQQSQLATIAKALRGHEQPDGAWLCHCPAHDDTTPSLTLCENGDGKLLWHCFAGCSQEAVRGALKPYLGAYRPAPTKRHILATYDYVNADGVLQYQVVRYEPKDFRQRKPDGHGGWEWQMGDTPRILYHLPAVLQAVREKRIVYVVEGEKAADALSGIGLAATCSPQGAGKWHKVDQSPLCGASVVILPDNDEPGRTHARQVQQALQGVAAHVTIMELPGLPEKGDIADWLQTHTTEDFQALHTPPGATDDDLPTPITLTTLLAKDIPEPIQLVEGLLHEGLLLFGGKAKRGKSWLMLDLCLSLALGRSVFQHFPTKHAAPVLYLALEDGEARIQRRTRSIQDNLKIADNLHLLFEFPPLAEGGIDILTRMIDKYGYTLIVIDVLAKLEAPNGPRQQGEKSYHDVYKMFSPLQAMRHTHHFALAMLTHLRKQEAEDVFENLHGSVAYQGAQDVLWVMERKPKDDIALLHLRDKDAEDKSMALRFMNGHWEYLGEGEEYDMTQQQRKIVDILQEEGRELGPQEILKACDMPESKYGYVRKILMIMAKEDLIHRTRHGKYVATIRGAQEFGSNDDVPF